MKQTRLHLLLKKREIKSEKTKGAAIMAVLANAGLRRDVEEGPLPWTVYNMCTNLRRIMARVKKSQLSVNKIILSVSLTHAYCISQQEIIHLLEYS
jgi:hypothetical protein